MARRTPGTRSRACNLSKQEKIRWLLLVGGLLRIAQVLGRLGEFDVRQFFLGGQVALSLSICHEGVPTPTAEGGFLRAQVYPRGP